MAAVFPDAAACLENIPGDRADSRSSAGDADRARLPGGGDGLRGAARACWTRIHRGELRLIARDTPEPSPFAHEILNARPYAFLDDAPLEERRSAGGVDAAGDDPASAGDLGALDARRDRARARRGAAGSARRRRAARRAADRRVPDRADELDGARPELLADADARRAARATRARRRRGRGRPWSSRPSGCRSCARSIRTRSRSTRRSRRRPRALRASGRGRTRSSSSCAAG